MLVSRRFFTKTSSSFVLNNKQVEKGSLFKKVCFNNLPVFSKIPHSQTHESRSAFSGLVGNSNKTPYVLRLPLFTSIPISIQSRRINSAAFTTDELKRAGFCVYFITNDMKSGEELNQKKSYINRSKREIEEIFKEHPASVFLILQKTNENKSPLEHGHIAFILTDEKGSPMFDQYGSFQGGSSLGFRKENPTVKVKAKYPNGKQNGGLPKSPSIVSYDKDVSKLLSKAKIEESGNGWYIICMPPSFENTKNLDNFKTHFDSIKNEFLKRYYVLLCCELIMDEAIISKTQKDVDLYIKSKEGFKLIVDSGKVQANNCISLVFKLLSVYIKKADIEVYSNENPTTQQAAAAILKLTIKKRLILREDGHSQFEEDLQKIMLESKLFDAVDNSIPEVKELLEKVIHVLETNN